MDPINPIAGNPESVNQSPKPVETKQSNNITIISVALFILMSLGVITFLYYQNQQLKSMLASYQTPVVSPTPTATVDPIASWQTFTDSNNKYSFKFPENWATSLSKPNKMLEVAPQDRFSNPVNGSGPMASFFPIILNYDQPIGKLATTPSRTEVVNQKDIFVSGKKATEYLLKINQDEPGFNLGDQFTRVTVQNTNTTYFEFELFDSSYQTTFDQILSTFKFTSASPSATPSMITVPISTQSGIPSGY